MGPVLCLDHGGGGPAHLRKDNFCGSLKIDAECACCKRDERESVIRVILVQLNLLVSWYLVDSTINSYKFDGGLNQKALKLIQNLQVICKYDAFESAFYESLQELADSLDFGSPRQRIRQIDFFPGLCLTQEAIVFHLGLGFLWGFAFLVLVRGANLGHSLRPNGLQYALNLSLQLFVNVDVEKNSPLGWEPL